MKNAGVEHLAVIMDGNGRWAERRGLPRTAGHREGAVALERVMNLCREAGIKHLTVYAFSTENWKRSAEEVGALMKLLAGYIRRKGKTLEKEGVRFRAIGRREDLPESLQKAVSALEERTKNGSFTLCVALSYGGRDEIVRAARRMFESRRGVQAAAADFTERDFAGFLDAPDIPDPDLVIRTSGEVRTSNFLMWETAYSEWYFTDVLWPDFSREDFENALADYAGRERRMGGRPEQKAARPRAAARKARG